MRGNLIHFNYEKGQGLIRAEDGRRYAFLGDEWRAGTRPKIGDDVDFEIEGSTAYDVYLLNAAAAITAPQQGQQFAWRRPYSAAIIALMTLAGCLFPYIFFGPHSTSLFGVAPAISGTIDEMARLQAFGKLIGGQPPSLTGIRWTLGFGYLLYTVPLLSIVVVAFAFMGRRIRRLAFWHALSSIVLPIAVPVGVAMAVYEQMPRDPRRSLSSAPIDFDFGFTGFGFWVIVLGGVAQMINWVLFRKTWSSDANEKTLPAAS